MSFLLTGPHTKTCELCAAYDEIWFCEGCCRGDRPSLIRYKSRKFATAPIRALEAQLSIYVEILCLEEPPDHDQAHYRKLAEAVGQELGWSATQIKREITSVISSFRMSQLVAQEGDAVLQRMSYLSLGHGAGVSGAGQMDVEWPGF